METVLGINNVEDLLIDGNSNTEDWTDFETFDTADGAFQELENRKIWSKKGNYNASAGDVWIYRCNKVKFRDNACAAKARLLFHSRSQRVTLSFLNKDHTCNDRQDNKRFPTEVNDKVIELIKYNLKPMQIYKELTDQGYEYTKTQVRNLIDRLKKKTKIKDFDNFGELQEFLDLHNEVPDADNEGYIVDYSIQTGQNEEHDFTFVVSTKKLLSMAQLSNNFQSDATYKISLQNFNVLVCGHTDQINRFHPIAAGVSTKQRAVDFSFFFNTVKKACEIETNEEYQPQVTMRDFDDAIKNAYLEVFGEKSEDNTCYYHMTKNVNDKVSTLLLYPYL